jgi:hypothetical protein
MPRMQQTPSLHTAAGLLGPALAVLLTACGGGAQSATRDAKAADGGAPGEATEAGAAGARDASPSNESDAAQESADASGDRSVGPVTDAAGAASQDAAPNPADATLGAHSSVGCGRPHDQVTVGGVQGFDAFVDSSATTQLRACGASLYVHQVGWGNLPNDQDKKQIAANFAGTGGAVVEMAEATNLASDFGAFGITNIVEININAPTCEVPGVDDSISDWSSWVSMWKAQGVARAQYNDTPNCHFPVDWNTSTWDDSRTRAQAGGGVILDAPPSFYYNVVPQSYRDFVKAEVAWANGAGLHSTWILSPTSNADFMADTQQLVNEVNALPASQRPQEWALENYGQGADLGSETEAGSVANVALWVVRNGSTYQP